MVKKRHFTESHWIYHNVLNFLYIKKKKNYGEKK